MKNQKNFEPNNLEERKEKEKGVLFYFPIVGQITGRIIRIYFYILCLSFNLDPNN